MTKIALNILALSITLAFDQAANAMSNRYVLTCVGDVLVQAQDHFSSTQPPVDDDMQSGISIFGNVENSLGPITRTFEISPRFVTQSEVTGHLHSFRQSDVGKKYFYTGVYFKATQDEVNDFVENHLAAERKKLRPTDTYDYEVTHVLGIYIRVEKSLEPHSHFFITAFPDSGGVETIKADSTGVVAFKRLPNTKLKCAFKRADS
jgi:hypothetical protein